MLSDSWKFVGAISFYRPSTALPGALAAILQNRVIKIQTVSSTQNLWRRAAYMKQVIDQAEVDNRVIPLNQETIFQLSPLPDRYGLVFTPVRWLPDLTIRVWEYTGTVDYIPDLVSPESTVNDGVIAD
jgi:hypothetical protein